MLPTFAKKSETAIPIHVVESDSLKNNQYGIKY
jgi:hypothetical protein